MRQIRRKVGTYLRQKRLDRKMILDEVIVCLDKDCRIKCSKSNLARIERNEIPCRHDILAGICKILDISADEVLFRSS